MSGGVKIPEFRHNPHIVAVATPTSDGVMSSEDKTKLDALYETTIVRAVLDADIPAPNAAAVSRYGSASATGIIVPADATEFRVQVNGLVLLNSNLVNSPNPTLGTLAVLDSTAGAVIAPNVNGVFTVIAGHTLVLSQGVLNLFTNDFVIAAAVAADWGVIFEYSFA